MAMFQPFKAATKYKAPQLMKATAQQGILDAQAQATENAQRAETYNRVGELAGAYNQWGDANDYSPISDYLRKQGFMGGETPINEATQEGLTGSMPSVEEDMGGVAGMPTLDAEMGGVSGMPTLGAEMGGLAGGMPSVTDEMGGVADMPSLADELRMGGEMTDAAGSMGMPNMAGLGELSQGDYGGAALNAGATYAANLNPYTAAALQLYKLFS